MKIELPEKVKHIIEILQSHGHEAYAVGGCVRDSLLGRIPEDWDITTSADPYETRALFPRTVDTGIKHGTVTVMLGREGFEVTTYRIDGEYEDGRHPKQVEFTKSLREDLARRDFTINAMAYNDADGLVDIFGGVEDLKRKVIRCVGDAGCRFDEDALRILRAYRFAAQLHFSIEEQTAKAAKSRAENLRLISAERIHAELNKLLLSPHPEMLLDAYEAGLTRVFLLEFDKMMETQEKAAEEHDLGSVVFTEERSSEINFGIHALEVIRTLPLFTPDTFEKKQRLILALSALLAPAGETAAGQVLHRLKYDNETIYAVRRLTQYYSYRWTLSPTAMRRSMYEIGPEYMERLFVLQFAENTIRGGSDEELKTAADLYHGIVERGECVSLKMLAVNGGDLIKAGHVQGKELGDTLHWLLMNVLEHPEWNEKEQLLRMVENIYRNEKM